MSSSPAEGTNISVARKRKLDGNAGGAGLSPAKKVRTNRTVFTTGDDEGGSDCYWNRHPLSPLRADDKQRWPGFRELESEAQDFEAIIKRLGIKQLVIREVFGLEKPSLDLLPTIRGFILCSNVNSESEGQIDSCPPDVWFANQTHLWLCGSNALLNIVNNLPDIELGEHLTQFKEFTRDFNPVQRGEAVANFAFLRRVHNSSLRKMEILAADVDFMKRYDGRDKKKICSKSKQPSKKSRPRRSGGAAEATSGSDDEGGLHYTAFLPINGYIWKLDGLDRQPVKLDACTNTDWFTRVGEIIQAEITATQDFESNVMAVCQESDPLAASSLENETRQLERHDYEPLVRSWVEMLAKKEGVLSKLLASQMSKSKGK